MGQEIQKDLRKATSFRPLPEKMQTIPGFIIWMGGERFSIGRENQFGLLRWGAVEQQMKSKKNRIVEYDMIRVLCMLMLIFACASFNRILTEYGSVDYTGFLGKNLYCTFYKNIAFFSEVINEFCPALLMALNGSLFCKTYTEKKTAFSMLIISKVKRLLIPFVFVSCLYVFPLKWIAGYYSGSENYLYDFLVGQILLQGHTHLWYLVTLFFIDAEIYLMEKLIKNNCYLKILFFFLMSCLSFSVPVVLIQLIMRYSLWFYAGYCFEKYRAVFNYSLRIINVIESGCMFTVLFLLDGYISNNLGIWSVFIQTILQPVCTLAWCCTVYGTGFYLSRSRIAGNPIYKIFLANILEIYLYSEPVNYVILSIAVMIAGNRMFISNTYACILFIIRFFTMLLLSLLISINLRNRVFFTSVRSS